MDKETINSWQEIIRGVLDDLEYVGDREGYTDSAKAALKELERKMFLAKLEAKI